MPVTIDSLRLYNAQESASEGDGEVTETSAPMMETDETLLVGLTAVEAVSLSGRATGGVISRAAGYSSDPDTALREWTLQFESLCTPNQGSGYTLTDDERNRSINVIVQEASWKRTGGGAGEVMWDLTAVRGDGILDVGSRSPGSPATVTTEKLVDGATTYDLGALMEKKVTRRIQLQSYPLALSGVGANSVGPKSGVTRTVVYSGVKYGTTTDMRTFDDGLRALLGQDKTVEYHEVFPGRSTPLTVMVSNYDSTYREGQVHAMDYYLKLVEGVSDF